MKILVVSDSHGALNLLNKVLEIEYDSDVNIHLGDSELPEYLLSRFCAIRGNCDYNDLPLIKDIVLDDFKIHLEHGNGYLFNFYKEDYIKNLNCDIFLFGHTHHKLAKKIDDTYIFNPGSLTRPRDGEYGSYLILNLLPDKKLSYEFKLIKGDKFKEFL